MSLSTPEMSADPTVEDMITHVKAMAADRRAAGAPGVPTDEEIEAAMRQGAAEGKARARALFGTRDKHGNRNLPPQVERDTGGAGNIRQAMRSQRRGGGKKRTPSLEEAYGSLIRQGLVKIVRKKGRAPQVVFLRPGQIL